MTTLFVRPATAIRSGQVLVVLLAVLAGSMADAASSRVRCRRACREQADLCSGTTTERRDCKRRIIHACRDAVCTATTTLVPTTTTSTTRPSTTSTLIRVSPTTLPPPPITLTTSTTTRPPTTSTSTTRPAPTTTSTTLPRANAAPRANAGADQFTQTLTAITFDGSASSDSDGTITAYNWTFGDGATASGRTVSHSYRTAGTYTVTLTVTDDDGARASDTATAHVSNRAPVANAGADRTAAVGAAVAFDGRGSSDPDGTISSYSWAFGDGTTASGATVSHTYGRSGTYTATLTVTDDAGAGASDAATITVTASGGNHVWSKTFGGPEWTDNVVPQATAVVPNGNVVVVGYFAGTVNLGGGAVTSTGGDDIFVAEYAGTDGRYLWSKHFGDTSHDFATAVTVDASNNVLVGGNFSGSIDFGGGALTTTASSPFLAKFSASGAHVWSKLVSGSTNGSVTGIALAGDGTLFTTGTFNGSANFGTGAMTSAGSWDGYLLATASTDGHALWARRFGGSQIDTPRAVTVDAFGHVTVTGVFQSTADFGGGPLASAGGYDIFLVQYATADGRHVWSKRFGDTGNDYGVAIDVDAAGNLFVGGDFHGTVNFGGGAMVDPGSASASYVVAFSSAGTHAWSKMFTTDYYDVAMKGLTVDRSGNVAFTLTTVGAIDCGGGALPMSGGGDPIVAELSGAGAHLWSKRFPSASQAYNASAAIAADGTGNVFVTGEFTGTIDFGGGPVSDANGRTRDSFDGFLVKLGQ